MEAHSKWLMAAAAMLLTASTARSQEGLANWLDPQLGKLETRVSYAADYNCRRGVEDQREAMGFTDHRLSVLAPLLQDEHRELAAIGRAGAMDFEADARLPDTDDAFPEHLWDLRLGLAYRQRVAKESILGLGVTVGSPSDKPFASGQEVSVEATGSLRIPHGQKNAWLLLLHWSNDREFLPYVPLPGAGYYFEVGERLRVLAGAPLCWVAWEPLDRLELSASYALLRTVHAKASYRLHEDLSVYAAFDWTSRRYFRHDRREKEDRLFFYAKRVAGGLLWQITPQISLDLSGGYAFDRFFFEAEEYDERDENRVKLSDGPFVALAARLRL